MQHTYDSHFMNYTDRSSRHSARAISALLRQVMPVASVLDIGCAKGTWLSIWREGGVNDIVGVDGDYIKAADMVIPGENFVSAALAQPIDLQRKFDLVQSLEVAEHIRSEAADQFVKNLVRH